MPRRSATMLAATLLLIALLCASVLMKVPYTEMSPGPTYNTLGTQEEDGKPVIQITGHETYPTSGHLNMTTVQVTGAKYEPSLVSAVIGWLRGDVLVVPHGNVYPEGQTDQEAQQQNAEEFASSEDSAKTAALNQLGIPVGTQVVVKSVVAGGPSEGKLHAGDRIVAVDGTKVTTAEQVAELVTKHQPGETVVFTIVPKDRGGAAATAADEVQVPVVTGKAADGNRAVVGIRPDVEHTYPFKIDIGLQDVGGPSAGLMFSLGIVDKLTPTDLTAGKFVAGTGTITDEGKVGPIGGIAMKLIAARDKGAEYFFTPADNCAEATKDTPKGLRLVKAETLDGALKSLDLIRAGQGEALPACATG
ncbi:MULTISPECIES: PDZ domain-containing protein [unclassified Kitasatospora]|uniref:YlbL family protein n=1 Tax=unclassified Kitasatospora TaxID=2633591 RepID=UPI0007089D52|nr:MULTISPECIES: PDZ domain-containing protein [unclassified Kitasatospora]KQV23815.1 PDZ/DHR/GLGF domain-containing protein [Kitasatospora sp. Root107]KRB67472.1 PDZ/DHR/GLGF domain-containing protein [Kitasatospora sp. Root187]